MSGWRLALNFAALTFAAAVLAHAAGRWWRVRRNGAAVLAIAVLFLTLAAIFGVFWLVRLNTIVVLVPVEYGYYVLREWLWVLYLALGIAAWRCQP